MIVDALKHRQAYADLFPRLTAGLEYISSVTAERFPDQEIEIDGRDVFAVHMTYDTVGDEGRAYEAHLRYIDVQYVLSGEERIRVTDVSEFAASSEPDSNGNSSLHLTPGKEYHLKAGCFAVLFPHEAHVPILMSGRPSRVSKVVVKVRI